MPTPYNHKEIEKKWKKYWEENPINVNDGKNLNITVLICSLIRREAAFM
jgi:leucyl-tRNA synthetase (EC 6.1.1.4)